MVFNKYYLILKKLKNNTKNFQKAKEKLKNKLRIIQRDLALEILNQIKLDDFTNINTLLKLIEKYLIQYSMDNFGNYNKNYNKSNIQYWKQHGFSDEEAEKYALIKRKEINKKRKYVSPFSIEFWIRKGYTKEKAIKKISELRPNNINYWLKQGYSEEEAKQKLKEFQQIGSKRRVEYAKITPERYKGISPVQLEYWLKQGYSEEKAKQKLKERQTTFTLEKQIDKFGPIQGYIRWHNRQQKWQNSLNSKSEEEKREINKKKALTLENMIRIYGEKEGEKKYKEWLEKTRYKNTKAYQMLN
jgi:predicted RNase H-like HicB family nuclease